MNSCVQWITQNDTTKAIWEHFLSGENPEFRVKGDQFFTYSTIQHLDLEHRLGYFPDNQIQSYKVLRSAHRRSQEEFEELYKLAKIVKFHGIPRATDILDTWRQIQKVSLRYPRYMFKDWNFLVEDIRKYWK